MKIFKVWRGRALRLAAMCGVLLAAATGTSTGSGAASRADFMGRVEALVVAESQSCELGHVASGVVSSQSFDTYSEDVVVRVFSTEGCNGGNNWGTGARAYYVRQPARGPAQVKRIPLDQNVMEAVDFSWTKSVTFASDPKPAKSGARTSSIEIIGLKVGDGDGRCCPTDVQQIRLWIDDGRFKATLIKRRKEEKAE